MGDLNKPQPSPAAHSPPPHAPPRLWPAYAENTVTPQLFQTYSGLHLVYCLRTMLNAIEKLLLLTKGKDDGMSGGVKYSGRTVI